MKGGRIDECMCAKFLRVFPITLLMFFLGNLYGQEMLDAVLVCFKSSFLPGIRSPLLVSTITFIKEKCALAIYQFLLGMYLSLVRLGRRAHFPMPSILLSSMLCSLLKLAFTFLNPSLPLASSCRSGMIFFFFFFFFCILKSKQWDCMNITGS